MMPVRWWGAVVLVLASCTSAEPPIGEVPLVRTGADIVLPLDRYQLTTERFQLLQQAVDVVGARCMSRFGLTWASGTGPPPPFSNARRYGNLDPAVASAQGYRSPVAKPSPRPPVSKDAESVWLGKDVSTYRGLPVPSGGCVGETMRQLKPGIDRIEAGLPQKLQWQSYSLAEEDSRIVRVVARWRSCMADMGFQYADTSAAANDPRWRTPQPSPQETVTAVADVECKLRTNLPGVLLAVETAYQHRLLSQHARALDAVMAYADKEVAIARQAVQGAPAGR